MKHTTKELYGVEPSEFMNLKYINAIRFKISKAKEQMNVYRLESNEDAYISSEKAKLFNEKLLEELGNS